MYINKVLCYRLTCCIYTLNAELNHICHLLALLGTHHILHVSRIRDNVRPVHGAATYRCDGTRGCIIQFLPPDDEHMCSKHVEAWNKLIVEQILCIKLVNF